MFLRALFPCYLFIVSVVIAAEAVVLPMSFVGRPIPRTQNGFILAILPDRLSIEVYDRTGGRRALVLPSVPSAGHQIRDCAAASDGTIAVPMSAKDATGRIASLIGWYSANGDQIRLVSTGAFAANHVAFQSDGTLWASGREHDLALESLSNRDILHHYDNSGRLIGTTLNSSSFQYDPKTHPTAESFLIAGKDVTGKDKVAFISVTTKVAVLISPDGKESERRFIPDLNAGEFISGAVLLPNGDLLFSIQGREAARFSVLRAGEKSWISADNYKAPDSYAVIGVHEGQPITYGRGKLHNFGR